jgi:hypothetical protein
MVSNFIETRLGQLAEAAQFSSAYFLGRHVLTNSVDGLARLSIKLHQILGKEAYRNEIYYALVE